MRDQMMHDMEAHIFGMWVAAVLIVMMFTALVVFFTRRAANDRSAINNLAARLGDDVIPSRDRGSKEWIGGDKADARDTIFILPDISHYSRFMTQNQFAFGHAQQIVFALINAIIEAATNTIELSKLEGDAALFFVDAERHSKETVGQTIMEILGAFYSERRRLIASNICPCAACRQIGDLELKVFVHRGQASRFKFRGTVDLFGTDVIILHRLMKNGVQGDRYVMVTDAATDSVALGDPGVTYEVEEHVPHVGKVHATIFELDDDTVTELSQMEHKEPLSSMKDTLHKLRENVRSIKTALSPGT